MLLFPAFFMYRHTLPNKSVGNIYCHLLFLLYIKIEILLLEYNDTKIRVFFVCFGWFCWVFAIVVEVCAGYTIKEC